MPRKYDRDNKGARSSRRPTRLSGRARRRGADLGPGLAVLRRAVAIILSPGPSPFYRFPGKIL